ncbi:hypothetical protein CJA_3688 [Cellvibrio japonicus Ueda107]|uniref:eCIS core domain-containing protein n=2 Tax=Cellvibrio japonicus TaxID=155077 RepID=B3PHU5_CELJU|nr:hypothetical protein CJA_3688 [Cellvibrio japonicus Ueda107]
MSHTHQTRSQETSRSHNTGSKVISPKFADQRSSTLAQLKQQAMMGSTTAQRADIPELEEETPAQGKFVAQRAEADGLEEEPEPAQLKPTHSPPPIQRAEKPNNTGLPNQLKAGIESLSGMSMDHVKVHYNSDKPAQLNAHAYAQGSDIHVAPGQEQHLPHEAWHVVQQAQGRVKPTMQMKTGVPVNDDVGLEHEADVMGAKAMNITSNSTPGTTQLYVIPTASNNVLQGAFTGVPLVVPHNPVNVAYHGHQFNNGGTRANTGCGTNNTIITAGEKKNSGSSLPGSPSGMQHYQYSYSRTGGLVRDPALNQASTRIHLINHRLENSANTQATAGNILLGSKRANNPTHLHNVENYVIKALSASSQENATYQATIANATTLTDADIGGNVTYWDRSNTPSTTVLPAYHLTDGWLDKNGQVTRTPTTGSATKKIKHQNGTSSTVPVPDGYFVRPSIFLPQHLWLEYNVTANYGATPAFVQNNINHERTQNGGGLNPTNQVLENNIQHFETSWKDDAFPSSFTSNASYYIASWIPGSPYHQVNEAPETIQTDT